MNELELERARSKKLLEFIADVRCDYDYLSAKANEYLGHSNTCRKCKAIKEYENEKD